MDAPSSSSDPSMAAAANTSATNAGGKVKQTRRRQRLSCVECTKRRQRCDRQFPCGLCTTRGIAHLCRWEPIVARPAPQRPPVEAINAAANATIETLSARIAALEAALLKQQGGESVTSRDVSPQLVSPVQDPQSPETVSDVGEPHPTSTPPDADGEKGDGPRALIDFNVQSAAIALAQLSLAPRTEYVGSGTVLCAIHKLGDPDSYRFPLPTTIVTSPVSAAPDNTSSHQQRTWEILAEGMNGLDGYAPPYNGFSSPPDAAQLSPIRRLVAKLPPRPQLEELLTAFFTERNWQFGIPEGWFRSACQQMWGFLDMRCAPGCRGRGGCAACKEDINPHWLSLLFAVLALAPSSRNTSKNCARYFMHALTARRFVEDVLLVTPVYSTSEGTVHGGVLSCYSAVLLAMYLVDRGRVSEGWKLIGNAVRHAQALGMHRDPGWRRWEQMHAVDRELRITVWWLLIVSDRMWSFILGRPPMAPKGTYDVLALPAENNADGSPNPCASYHKALIALSDIIDDTMGKCLGIHAPPYATVLEMDRRFQDWEAQLPDKLKWRRTSAAPSPAYMEDGSRIDPHDLCTAADRVLAYQRNTLAGWYLCGLMNLHRPYLMHAPPILPPPGTAAGPRTKLMLNPSRERCIEVALEITRVMADFHDELAPWREPGRLNASVFSYFLFDGAVALAGALSQVPPHPQSGECLALLDTAMATLAAQAEQAAGALDGEGEMAKRAMVILKSLRRAGGWDKRDEEKGELVLLQDMLQQTMRQNQQPSLVAPPVSPPAESNFDFYPNVAPMPSSQAFSSIFGTQPSTSTNANAGSSFIPYLGNSTSYPPVSNPSMFTAPPQRSFPPMPTGYSDIEMAFGGMRPQMQSMVMPFDVLQGVQPDSQDMEDLDLDWARIAGMESWYSGTSSTGESA